MILTIHIIHSYPYINQFYLTHLNTYLCYLRSLSSSAASPSLAGARVRRWLNCIILNLVRLYIIYICVQPASASIANRRFHPVCYRVINYNTPPRWWCWDLRWACLSQSDVVVFLINFQFYSNSTIGHAASHTTRLVMVSWGCLPTSPRFAGIRFLFLHFSLCLRRRKIEPQYALFSH